MEFKPQLFSCIDILLWRMNQRWIMIDDRFYSISLSCKENSHYACLKISPCSKAAFATLIWTAPSEDEFLPLTKLLFELVVLTIPTELCPTELFLATLMLLLHLSMFMLFPSKLFPFKLFPFKLFAFKLFPFRLFPFKLFLFKLFRSFPFICRFKLPFKLLFPFIPMLFPLNRLFPLAPETFGIVPWTLFDVIPAVVLFPDDVAVAFLLAPPLGWAPTPALLLLLWLPSVGNCETSVLKVVLPGISVLKLDLMSWASAGGIPDSVILTLFAFPLNCDPLIWISWLIPVVFWSFCCCSETACWSLPASNKLADVTPGVTGSCFTGSIGLDEPDVCARSNLCFFMAGETFIQGGFS